jgi:uridylate kinase
MAVVVGGGNIWRGMTGAGAGMDRAQADYMGMLATVINALACRRPWSASASPPACRPRSTCPQVAEPYIRRRAIRHLEKGRVVIFAGGPATRSSPPTPPPRCAPSRSTPTRS